jgi:hypothetical protein
MSLRSPIHERLAIVLAAISIVLMGRALLRPHGSPGTEDRSHDVADREQEDPQGRFLVALQTAPDKAGDIYAILGQGFPGTVVHEYYEDGDRGKVFIIAQPKVYRKMIVRARQFDPTVEAVVYERVSEADCN